MTIFLLNGTNPARPDSRKKGWSWPSWDAPHTPDPYSLNVAFRFIAGSAALGYIPFSDLCVTSADDVAVLAALCASGGACLYSVFDEIPPSRGAVRLKTVYSILFPLVAIFFAFQQRSLEHSSEQTNCPPVQALSPQLSGHQLPPPRTDCRSISPGFRCVDGVPTIPKALRPKSSIETPSSSP
jgi:hypothetical protein